MKKLKFIVGFAVFGFLFSLIIGLIARVDAGMLFLRAFIFAVVFAAMGFGVSVLSEKFFESDGSDDVSGDVSEGSGTSGMGQNVNIVTPDEPLPVDNEASQFFVGDKHQMLAKGDYGSSSRTDESTSVSEAEQNTVMSELEPVLNTGSPQVSPVKEPSPAEKIAQQNAAAITSESKPEKPSEGVKNTGGAAAKNVTSDDSTGFKPVSLAETAGNITSVEATSKTEYAKVNKDVNNSQGSEELDALPDIQDLQEIADMSGSSEEGSSSESSEESFSEKPKSSHKTGEDIAQGQDTALIAKAISTILAKDKQ